MGVALPSSTSFQLYISKLPITGPSWNSVLNTQQCFAFLCYSWNPVCRVPRFHCVKHPIELIKFSQRVSLLSSLAEWEQSSNTGLWFDLEAHWTLPLRTMYNKKVCFVTRMYETSFVSYSDLSMQGSFFWKGKTTHCTVKTIIFSFVFTTQWLNTYLYRKCGEDMNQR